MDIGDSGQTIDLTPGATHGVLFDGMTEDGSKVFFTTTDTLLPTRHRRERRHLLRPKSSEEEAQPLTLISTGAEGAGNTASCDPVDTSGVRSKTTLELARRAPNCGGVAIGGGGGRRRRRGHDLLPLPRELEGSERHRKPAQPLPRSPRLSRRASSPPSTPNDPLVLDAVKEAETRNTADFQVTPSGEFAVFTSTAPLDRL